MIFGPGLKRPPAGVLATVLALAVALAGPAAADVHVAVSPATANVSPGAEFDLTIEVTQAGAEFNRFSAVVTYDTTALTFLPASPLSLQEGCLLTGLCSSACGATFHQFAARNDSLLFSDGLLCSGGSLTGPGTLYRLHFRAADSAQVTTVRLREAKFWNAGLIVSPVVTADALVGIGVALAVDDPAPRAALAVRAVPNPARGGAMFAIESDRPGERRVEIHDLAGRLVRRLDGGPGGPGTARVAWDGRDRTGARVSPGVYLVTVRAGGRVARTQVAVIE